MAFSAHSRAAQRRYFCEPEEDEVFPHWVVSRYLGLGKALPAADYFRTFL